MSYKPNTCITEESAGLHLAQCLKRRGYRVLVHDYAATHSNSPSLHEFEILEDLETIQNRKEIKVAVVCCSWPQYKDVKFHPETKVFTPWKR